MEFNIAKTSKKSQARLGFLKTSHGVVETPCLVPVATQAVIKTLTSEEVARTRSQILICNTYHLHLRQAEEVIQKSGGLHKFMNWNKPILTDSGGFQVFSLSGLRKINSDGVEFKSHLDGSSHFFSAEKVVQIQRIVGSDIMMVLDECLENPAEYEKVKESVKRTASWAKKSKTEFENTKPNYGFKQFIF